LDDVKEDYGEGMGIGEPVNPGSPGRMAVKLACLCVQALIWKPLPSLVFGIVSTVSGLLYFYLPETLGHVLPDTIEQAERFERLPKTDQK